MVKSRVNLDELLKFRIRRYTVGAIASIAFIWIIALEEI